MNNLNIKEIRALMGLTQSEFAQEVGVFFVSYIGQKVIVLGFEIHSKNIIFVLYYVMYHFYYVHL